MQVDAVMRSGELRRLLHQARRDREWGTWCEHNCASSHAITVVVLRNQPLGVLQDVLLILDTIVGREAALACTARHGAPRRVEPQTKLLSRPDFGIHTTVVGENVQMV